jgi:aminoglycoside 3-N-acetyltransferase
MASDLRSLGVIGGGVLLVHSSLSSLGELPGGPETVVRALLEAVGTSGTLLMPALSYNHVNAGSPVFDVLNTPSNVGAIPEHFRKRRRTLRSVHPTHSACGVGPAAEAILADHHLDSTPAGLHSPLRRLEELDGQILMLGCGLLPNTSMHAVEELVEPPYLFGRTVDFRLIHADRTETIMHCRCHSFDGYRQRYDRIAGLLTGNQLRTGDVLHAACQLIEVRAMWREGLDAMRRDPLFFVEKV